MQLMTIAQRSLHGVIRTAAMSVQDSNFQMIEFLESYPSQVSHDRVLLLDRKEHV